MPKLKHNVNPAYRLHKQSGQAIATVAGRDVLLGKHGTDESREKYERLIFEWRAAGRQFPKPSQDKTISELLVPYREHVLTHYRRPDGTPTSESGVIRAALRPLRLLYGSTVAAEFGSLQLEALREYMIHPPGDRLGLARTTANKQINRVRQFFKWVIKKKHIPAAVLVELQTVDSLKEGRTDARETEAVGPVSESHVEAVLPFVSPQIAALIRLQLLTAARPGELLKMRSVDLARVGKMWIYRPQQHKTRHRGHAREILIGPKAQGVLAPFLKTDLSSPIFSPSEAEADRRQRRHAKRKTPLNAGNAPGDVQTLNPSRAPGDFYTVGSYRRAIIRGADKADSWAKGGMVIANDERLVQRWHPHQLRHNAATAIRREHGVDMARIILGQKCLEAAEIYAESDRAKAIGIMEAIG